MRYLSRLLVLVAAFGFCHPAQAGIFTRKPKVDAAEQVPALIMQLKTDKDDAKRQTAAEELRNFDTNAFPEIMTVLVDALTRDTSTGVRAEAAATIAKLRPINQQAGFASSKPRRTIRPSACAWRLNKRSCSTISSAIAARSRRKARTNRAARTHRRRTRATNRQSRRWPTRRARHRRRRSRRLLFLG